MKTLYININNEQIQTNDELEVLNHDLDSDFFFYLGERIAKGCKISNENALITDFNTPDNKQDFDSILSQWNEVKRILFGERIEGTFEFELPSGYLHWLRYNEDYNHVYDANFSNGERKPITIDLEELYEDTIEDLQRKIMRRLKRDDLYLEIDEIIFNDENVSRKSLIVRAIKEKYEGIGFKSYKKWTQEHEHEHELKSAERAKADINKSNENSISSNDFFPYKGFSLGETRIDSIDAGDIEEENNLIFYSKGGNFLLGGIKGLPYFVFAYVDDEILPGKWSRILGCKIGKSFKDCNKSLADKKFQILLRDEENEILAISSDKKYFVILIFDYDSKFETLWLMLNKCPYCNSTELEIKNIGAGGYFPYCSNCNKLCLPVEEDTTEDADDDSDDEDTPCCPSCSSNDVDDDGSNYLQYTCNDCGHNWGHDDTVECPECGSNDVENDGTDNLQYECNACGHMWGDEEEGDDYTFDRFFPVCGITLNKTTVQDVERQAYRYAKIEHSDSGLVTVKINNGGFGTSIRKEIGCTVFTYIRMDSNEAMFPEWSRLGFDWRLSYNEWVSLFKKMEFTIIQTHEPRIESWEHGPDYLSANFVAISKDRLLKFELDFLCGRNGNTLNSPSTLSSIQVFSKDYSWDFGPKFGNRKRTFYDIEDAFPGEPKKYL